MRPPTYLSFSDFGIVVHGSPPTEASLGTWALAIVGLWAHLLPGADKDAAKRIDDLLSGSKMIANQT